MKTYKLTALLIVAMMSTTMWAQKDNPYLKSYNYVRAMELLEKDNNSKEAMSLLEKEIAEHPKNGYAYFVMGLNYEQQEKFAEEAGYNYVFIKSSDLASIYVHGSQEKIGALFEEARKNAPTILNFDEFEALVPNRSKINNSSESGELNEFLSQMNNCGKDRIFVIAYSRCL